MLINLGYKNVAMQAILNALVTGASWQVWSGTVPTSADTSPTGTQLAGANFPGSPGTLDSANGRIVTSTLTSSAVSTTGVPTFVRIVDDQLRMQFTCKMAAATGTMEIVITDPSDSAATQLIAGRTFNMVITING